MIAKPQIPALLLEACPSFQPVWEKHICDYDEEITYVLLSDFAIHLLDLYRSGKTGTFPAVAREIERLHVEGDSYVREAATIGLLESIQNQWKNNGVNPELFFPFLLPESARWWKSLNSFWTGESKHVGETL
jgi:hypothetical protein